MATTEIAAESTEVGFVVAKIGGAFKRFRTLGHVPAGTEQVFTGEEDFAELKLKEIAEIYSAVTGQELKKFKDKKVGIKNLIYQFAKLPEMAEEEEAALDEPAAPAKSGRRKYVKQVRGLYRVMASTRDILKAISELAPQAQAVYKVMVDGGKAEYPEEELRAMVDEAKKVGKLTTTQPSWRIFQYYRGDLIRCDAIKDVATKSAPTGKAAA